MNISITKPKYVKRNFRQSTILFSCAAVLLVSCGGGEDEKNEYNPNLPTNLTSFYPEEGKFQEKVILTGENFPTDPDLVRVYFNSRRAPVIGSTGKRMYVMAPRLPGDVCKISVVVGGDSLTYADTFLYEESVTVTTIAGNGNSANFQEGVLSNAILQPRYLCVDKDNNIFVTTWNSSDANQYFTRINEEENAFVRLQQASIAVNIPCVDLETGIVSVASETAIGSFITCDPAEYWAPRARTMKFVAGSTVPPNGWKHCMVVNPTDGYIYTRWYQGYIVKIHPTTYEAQTIYQTEQGDSYGLTFNPLRPNILYISCWSNAGSVANSICSIDVTAPENTFQRLSSSATGGGHRDGELSAAQFRSPAQIFCDADGFIYVADYGNHCIRRITPENQVETVLGIPGTAGWKDGTRDEALFNNPRGIGIASDGSVYVADYGNSRVRKLSVN